MKETILLFRRSPFYFSKTCTSLINTKYQYAQTTSSQDEKDAVTILFFVITERQLLDDYIRYYDYLSSNLERSRGDIHYRNGSLLLLCLFLVYCL
jgi:hypothetical protein